jgi:hypothetical protein
MGLFSKSLEGGSGYDKSLTFMPQIKQLHEAVSPFMRKEGPVSLLIQNPI